MNLEQEIEYVNKLPGYMRHSGIRITAVDTDYAEVEADIVPESRNPLGNLHGGMYYTMADCAAGAAARSNGQIYVTLNGFLNFLKATSHGKVKSVATVLHRGKTTCVVRASVIDEKGVLLAEGNFTMFRVLLPEGKKSLIK